MKNQNLKQELEQTARQEVAEGRFDGSIEIYEIDSKPSFEGCIDTARLKEIRIGFNPEYEKRNPNKTKAVVRDITRHEINHRGYADFHGCPKTLDNHARRFIEPTADVLSPKGYSGDDFHYLANALEDTLLHSDLNSRFALDGIASYFCDVGDNTDKQRFTDFYEAHVKLNLYLWGNRQQKRQLKKYFSHKKEVNQVLQDFIKRTGIAELQQEIDGKQVADRDKIRRFLNDEANWGKIAGIYAEEFSKLMQPGYAMPIFNHSGKGTKGYGKGKESKKSKEDFRPEEGNEFDREMYSPDFKKRRIQEAHSSGEKVPSWMSQFEAMDILYQALAQRLTIRAETFTSQSSMPVFHYGSRPFDPEKDDLKQITFGFDDKGQIELRKKRWHQDMSLEYKVNPKGFPEVRFCMLDTSGSMVEPIDEKGAGKNNIIPWGDNSKYHFALLAWYGLLEYLKQNHLLQQTNIALANFGDETVLRQGLAEAKRLALEPQFGSTSLDLDKVRDLFRNQGMLVFTVSDGDIGNWDSIRDEFIGYAKQHYYFHLQIGRDYQASKDMKKAGLHVEKVTSGLDLASRVIDLTDKLYRGQ